MHYAYPDLANIGFATACLATGLLLLALLRQRLALRRLTELTTAQPWLYVSMPRRWLKASLLLVIFMLLGFALAGPQWGQVPSEAPPVQGRDVLILLDVSRSMQAEDVAPSRLERAKADVRDLAAALEREGGYRVGLIAFADRAAMLCPLTFDYRCFEEELSRLSLETLRLQSYASSGTEGTQIGAALRRAGRAIDIASIPYTDIVLVSDGGDMENDTLEAAAELARIGATVHCIGVGDPNHESLIPVRNASESATVLHYRGQPVHTRLEEAVLRQVAQRTGGGYLAITSGLVDLGSWYGDLITNKVARETHGSTNIPVYLHRFQWFLAPAVLLLLLEMIVRDTGRPSRATGKREFFRWVQQRRQRQREQQTA